MIHSLCLISSLFLSAVAQGPPGGQPFRRGPQEVRQEMRPPPSGRPAEMRPPAAQPPAEMRPPAAQPAEGAPPADQPVTEKPTEQPGTNAPFELYENFDMSAVLKLIPRPEDLTWENLLDIRSMLERPQLAFYADKVAFKQFVNQTLELDHARPLFVKNYPESPINATQAMLDIYNAIQGKTNFVAKVTHLADSIGIYVVEDGWNRYVYEGELPKQVRNEDIAKHLSELLLTHYDLTPLGVDTLSHVVPGVVVEERLSLPQDVFPTYGMSEMAALELKCYACWGKLWMCKMRRGPFVYQIIQRDGKPSNRFKASGGIRAPPKELDWPRIVAMVEKVAQHKDLMRVDVFVGVSAEALGTPDEINFRYLVNEVELFPNSKQMPFPELAAMWVRGYKEGNFVLVPNTELREPYASMSNTPKEEEVVNVGKKLTAAIEKARQEAAKAMEMQAKKEEMFMRARMEYQGMYQDPRNLRGPPRPRKGGNRPPAPPPEFRMHTEL